ncbi:MAG: 5-methyltetrahydropteroyltriglutamate--homocysteine methyltransferase [Haloferacaceae archaeon]|jgi:5-methyltetrahydropteroyltriglutamate--homocysteine methyltransferase
MSERVATTPGLYPQPDRAKAELTDLKGHQRADLIDGSEGEAVEEAYDRARATVVADQDDAGLDRVVEGQLRWDDLLAHPLAVSDAVETGGIVRYYDNNNFYRDPTIVDGLRPTGDVARELETAAALTEAPLQAVLPGPYALADLATDEHYGDEAALLAGVAEFLAGEVAQFPAHETLFLLDPSLVTNPPDDDVAEGLAEAVDEVAGATDADVVVHSYWGAHDEKTYAHLMDADVDAFGFDLLSDREDTLYNVTEYGTKSSVALGLVDGQNTRVESPETVAERVDWFEERVPSQTFEDVYLTSNTELFYLPVGPYREKLSTLAAAASGEDDAEEVAA